MTLIQLFFIAMGITYGLTMIINAGFFITQLWIARGVLNFKHYIATFLVWLLWPFLGTFLMYSTYSEQVDAKKYWRDKYNEVQDELNEMKMASEMKMGSSENEE